MPEHLHSTVKVPLSKVPTHARIGPCDKVVKEKRRAENEMNELLKSHLSHLGKVIVTSGKLF